MPPEMIQEVGYGLNGRYLVSRDHEKIFDQNETSLYDVWFELINLNALSRKGTLVIGTPYWMPPEMIQEVGCGLNGDIWSLGITIWKWQKESHHQQTFTQ
ncbi:serine/threonine-protein kinase hippo [Anaeramoeba flamelloides]|uniref:Serine/threonine-protein kinase hippo n=1 Tax=Anaeramoeba flamelloides TaxID=1746091 RepID=A0ABQ8ZCX4_9EUKA|nr:serine/threonine-protein kinase hippo [Anaeramoeba flamelloides]